MSDLLWQLVTSFGENRQVDTLLFGTITDDCHGTVIFKLIVIIINILLAGIIIAGTVGVIWSGIQILTARDNASQVANAKRRMLNSAIGIIAYAFMYLALSFIIPGGVSLDVVYDENKTCPETPGPSGPGTPGEPTNPPGPGEEEHGTREFVMCGMTFDVVKITVNGVKDDGTDNTGLKKFIREKIYGYHIDQSDGKVYNLTGSYTNSTAQNGHCDIVSRNIAYDMYFDTITADSCSAGYRYDRKAGFTTVDGDANFQKMYDDLMAGRPAVRRVSIHFGGNNYARHYATVVGVKKGADRNNLDNTDFLVLETFGGVLWNNIPDEFGGYRSNGGNGCTHTTSQNRRVYERGYFVPSSKTGEDRKDCGT